MSLLQDDELNYEQIQLRTSVRKFTGHSLSSPHEDPEETRHSEPRALTHPSDCLDSNPRIQDIGDDVASRSLGRQSSGVLTNFNPSHEPELARHTLGSFACAQLRLGR